MANTSNLLKMLDMSSLDYAKLLCQSYPETSPFELDPPLPNLRPAKVEDEIYDTEEFRAAARESMAAVGGMNPFAGQHGTNPFIIPREIQASSCRPIEGYTRPPLVPEADIRSPLQFIKQIHPHGCVHMFKVVADGNVRLLKVWPDRIIETGWKSPPTNPERWYQREMDAYAHLLRAGICAKGIVPMCYGRVDIGDREISAMIEVRAKGEFTYDVEDLDRDYELPWALLFEYFEDARTISYRNASFDVADTALRHLREIHTAYVAHGDISGRNILLLPDGRVVWINFDRSSTIPRLLHSQALYSRVTPRMAFLDEMLTCWARFYNDYLPDKRIYSQH